MFCLNIEWFLFEAGAFQKCSCNSVVALAFFTGVSMRINAIGKYLIDKGAHQRLGRALRTFWWEHNRNGGDDDDDGRVTHTGSGHWNEIILPWGFSLKNFLFIPRVLCFTVWDRRVETPPSFSHNERRSSKWPLAFLLSLGCCIASDKFITFLQFAASLHLVLRKILGLHGAQSRVTWCFIPTSGSDGTCQMDKWKSRSLTKSYTR